MIPFNIHVHQSICIHLAIVKGQARSPGADEDSIVATAADVEKILGPVDPVAVALTDLSAIWPVGNLK